MEVKIRVGASVDQSLRNAFKPLVQSAIDARRQITREFANLPRELAAAMGGAARGGALRGVAREQIAAARDVNREQVRLAREAARERIRAEKEVAREYARIGREGARAARELERERVKAVRQAEQEIAREQRAAAQQRRREAREAARQIARDTRELDRFATRTSYHSARFLTPHVPIASIAGRAARGLVSGLGIDPTFSGAAQRNIALEDAGVAFSNQARIAGFEVAPSEFERRVRGVQGKLGLRGEQSAGALLQYQKMTGNPEEAFALFEGLAERSARYSIDFNELGAAAGNISKALGDIPNKGSAVLNVLDRLAVQTTKGAIEMSDLQTQVAKFTAPARLIEGDAGENTARLAAIAQIARDIGGAASPQQAATAVSSLMNTFDKSARVKAFGDANIPMRGANGLLRRPEDLIMDAIVASGGDSVKLNKFIMDAQAKRAARGFLSEYNRAGGGDAGLAAMKSLMEHYMKGSISEETKNKNLAQHMGKTSTQVQQLQAEFDAVAKELQSELLPILREAKPTIVAFVRAMADLAAWAANNPGKAIVAAIVASIVRAGLESALRNALERAIMGTAGASGIPGALGASGGGGDVSKRVRFVRDAADVTAVGTLAALTTGLAADQANRLAKATGSKSSLADIIPGFRGGKFKGGDALMDDVLDVSILAPFMLFSADSRKNWKRKFGVIGEQADAAINMDDRMNSDARDRYLADQAKRKSAAPAAASPEAIERITGKSGEKLDALKARIIEEQRISKDEAAQRAVQEQMSRDIAALSQAARGGGLNVNVQNFPEEDGEGVVAPGGDT